MGRNDQTDAGRQGAKSQTNATKAVQMTPRNPKGEWFPAYGGGMGASIEQLDPDMGNRTEEVGA